MKESFVMSMRTHLGEPIPSWFKNTPGYQDEQARVAATADAARREALETLTALAEERDEALEPLTATECEAWAELKTAKATVAAKQKVYRLACGVKRDAAFDFDHRRNQLERIVRLNVPLVLVKFIHDMSSLARELRAKGPKVEIRHSHNLVRGRPRAISFSNSPSINRRLAAIQAAIDTAEKWRMEYVTNLPAALATLRNNLPLVTNEMFSTEPSSPVFVEGDPDKKNKKQTLLNKLFGE
jgi:hypothetical protein